MVPELCIYMQNLLMRGNRTMKVSADDFSAFNSPNYPYLAEVGVDIRYEYKFILQPDYSSPATFNYALDHHVSVLKLFPGITPEVVHAHLSVPGLKGLFSKLMARVIRQVRSGLSICCMRQLIEELLW